MTTASAPALEPGALPLPAGGPPGFHLLAKPSGSTCGCGPALEYNGDLYSCDHFVEPRYDLGNIHQTHTAMGSNGRASRYA